MWLMAQLFIVGGGIMAEEKNKSWEELLFAIESQEEPLVASLMAVMPTQDIDLVLSRLDDEDRAWFFSVLEPAVVADLIDNKPGSYAAILIKDLSPGEAGSIVDELATEDAVEVLGELSPKKAEEILLAMEGDLASHTRKSLEYPKNTAGYIMSHDILTYQRGQNIAHVREDLSTQQDKYAKFQILYIYVVDSQGRLVGVMKIHDLLFAPGDALLQDVMIHDPRCIVVTATLEEISEQFNQIKLLALPVVDEEQRLVGIVLPHEVEEAKKNQVIKQFMWLSGFISGEEIRSMPLYKRSGKRLSWLTLNIGLNILAAGIIALYQDTLAAAITLAVFLPMVSDMSGCSGNQAVAVSLRELALGILRPSEIFRVVIKESSLGIVNGIVLGTLLACVAYFWKQNIYLSMVIGIALAGNTLVAVTMGGVLPLLLKKLKIDPALVSSPVLTTVTDMCGFFLVLSLASTVLPKLAL